MGEIPHSFREIGQIVVSRGRLLIATGPRYDAEVVYTEKSDALKIFLDCTNQHSYANFSVT
jgi:hypothetical protein